MRKLPEIYKVNSTFKNNNTNSYYIKKDDLLISNNDKYETINSIFNGLSNPYTIKVFIKTKSDSFEDYLVSRNNKSITTLDNKTILLDDILFIKKI